MSAQALEADNQSTSTPTIFLLSLSKEAYWDEQFSALVDAISSKATIKRATKLPPAVKYHSENTPSAILITDAALTKRSAKFNPIREAVVAYVRNGGIAVIATHFSSFVRPLDMNHWFRTSWNLPWKNGDYHRTTVHLNSGACRGRLEGTSLADSYSQKAVFLKNVARDTAVYLPSETSRIESHVFSPSAVDTLQSPVVFAKIADGWLGYVGDVNSEVESWAVVVAMCGL